MHDAFDVCELIGPSELGPDAVTASCMHGNRLFLGTDKGSLLVFDLADVSTSTALPSATLVSKHKAFVKKQVDQLGIVQELNALVCLSGGDLSLHDISSCAQISSLSTHTKGAASLFTIWTNASAPSEHDVGATASAVIVTTVAVAAKRRLVLLKWVNAAWKVPVELALPHQIRGMAFNDAGNKVLAGFSTGQYGVVNVASSSANGTAQASLGDLFSVNMPEALSGSGDKAKHGSGGLGGLGSGWTGALGLASRKLDKNDVLAVPRISDKGKQRQDESVSAADLWLWRAEWGWEDLGCQQDEFLVVRENVAVPITIEGKTVSKLGKTSIAYSAATDDTMLLQPYIVSVLSTGAENGSKLVVHSSVSFEHVQTLSLESKSLGRVLPSFPGASFALFLATSQPVHSGTQVSVQSKTEIGFAQTLHVVKMRSWVDQIEQLGRLGRWDEAIHLLRDSNCSTALDFSPQLLSRLSRLHALSLFQSKKFSLAVDAFISLDTTPAKVVALYPETISGKLHLPEAAHESLFGGRDRDCIEPATVTSPLDLNKTKNSNFVDDSDTASVRSVTSLVQANLRESKSKPTARQRSDDVDELIRFLTDRRQKYARAFAALSRSSKPMPSTAVESVNPSVLLAIPDVPFSELEPDELVKVAQVVDTALFRSYLATKPVMVGPLCRIENWCQVEEVEELLLEAKKYRELLDLYNGKGLHSKALELLRRISQDEQDPEEKIGPTVRYLQKLGSEHLGVILENSKWVFEIDKDAAMQIFVGDHEEVESLPRHDVMSFLASIGSDVCQRYLENVIQVHGEQGAEFHEKLIDLYLADMQESKPGAYDKLVTLLETSTWYRADRILGRLPEDMPRIKALLLGRLGRHEGALQIYVHQLQDTEMAEEYCKRVSMSDVSLGPEVFLILLKIYLCPKPGHALQLEPALSLLSGHASSIDPTHVFGLLPPLVGVKDLSTYLERTLRHSKQTSRDAQIMRAIEQSRLEQSQFDLVRLESRRVKITETRVSVFLRISKVILMIISGLT
ncbi:Vacuolar morphogenesis protein 6 [Microbotryomycetes sp. JL201]|nr:Vacuolar morphogenesis protein 6 [Microbotryomycetes sp. JL201]